MVEQNIAQLLRRRLIGQIGAPMTPKWDEILVCPTCKGPLDRSDRGLFCSRCVVDYAVEGGVPRMIDWEVLADQVRQEMVGQDRHFAALSDKAVFKPALHPVYQRQRLQRRLADFLGVVGVDLPTGVGVHVACCGSGYEAEALAQAGYQVSASDISAQALCALEKRANSKGYQLPHLQADVNNLPFRDDSFAVVAVVEGLHHTPDPMAALRELVRVAQRRVVIIEPYTGRLWELLAKLKLAHRREYSGRKPAHLCGEMLADILSRMLGDERQRRLYIDLPPQGLTGWLGKWMLPAGVLLGISYLAEALLRPAGIGTKILWAADLSGKD